MCRWVPLMEAIMSLRYPAAEPRRHRKLNKEF